jgi:hypothetical protein
MKLSDIAEELLRFLLAYEEGISDNDIKNSFGPRYELLPSAINELLAINRLQLLTQNNSLFYKAIKEETAAKFDGLGFYIILYLFFI